MPSGFCHCYLNSVFLLVMKAKHPISGLWYYFIEKCLPFRASISCAHFQRFLNGLRAIIQYKASRICLTFITNYLDDFLFIYISQQGCNKIVVVFLDVCKQIGFPVAEDKTEWASPVMVLHLHFHHPYQQTNLIA